MISQQDTKRDGIMKKKTVRIIILALYALIFIGFEIFMYYAVGEEILLQKGPMRTLWLAATTIIVALGFFIGPILNRINKNKTM